MKEVIVGLSLLVSAFAVGYLTGTNSQTNWRNAFIDHQFECVIKLNPDEIRQDMEETADESSIETYINAELYMCLEKSAGIMRK